MLSSIVILQTSYKPTFAGRTYAITLTSPFFLRHIFNHVKNSITKSEGIFQSIHSIFLKKAKTPKAISQQPPGCIIKTHGSTRIFHSQGTKPLFDSVRKGGIHPSHCAGTHSHPAGDDSLLCRYLSVNVFLSVSGCPLVSYFLRRLYSERGFMTSRQSRSPRSRAMISTSAVAMLVATGMLYMSHIRSSSCSVSS